MRATSTLLALGAEYMTDPELCAKKAGIHMGDDESIIHPPGESDVVHVGGVAKPANTMPLITCQICYDQKADYSALQCGHAYCNTCYAQYLSHKIADEGYDCVYGRCPAEKVRRATHSPLILRPTGPHLHGRPTAPARTHAAWTWCCLRPPARARPLASARLSVYISSNDEIRTFLEHSIVMRANNASVHARKWSVCEQGGTGA